MTYLSDMQRNRLIDALAAGTEASLSEVGGDDAGYWGCKVAVKIKVSEQQGGSIIREHAFGPIYIPQPDEGADRRKEAREQYEGLYNEIAQIVVMHQAGTPFFGTPRVTQLAEPWS